MESLLRLDMYVVLVLCGIVYANIGVLAVDNYGLLYGVLRTFQAHACDGHELRLNCTHNTVVNINFVRYGREAGRGDLCPGQGTALAETCRLQNALTIIEEKCRGQMLCRFLIQPETFNEDPCPGVKKYAEVAYKCRPESFVNKIVCDGDWLSLGCPEGHGIAVYSAAFGTTREGVPECRQEDGIRTDECQVSYATEILMRRCNGQQKCHLIADAATFGDRNCLGRKHLKVAYSCVHRDILKRPTSPQTPPPEETIHTTSFPGWVRGVDRPLLNSLQEPSTPASNTFRSEMQSDEVPLDAGSSRQQISEERKVVGFMSEWMHAHKYITGNKEKLILYVTLTTGLGLVAFGTVLLGRYLVGHVRSRRRPSKLLPVAIDDPSFFSDSDIEQFDAELPPPPPPVVNYGASLRRQSSDAQPRAPVTDGSEHNEYFS